MTCTDQLNLQKNQNIFRFEFNMKFVSIVEFIRVFTTAGFLKHKQRWSLQQMLLKSFVFNDPTAFSHRVVALCWSFQWGLRAVCLGDPVVLCLCCAVARPPLQVSRWRVSCYRWLAQDGILFLQFCSLFAKLSQLAFPSYNKMSGIDYIDIDTFTCICFILKGDNLITMQYFVRTSSSWIFVMV